MKGTSHADANDDERYSWGPIGVGCGFMERPGGFEGFQEAKCTVYQNIILRDLQRFSELIESQISRHKVKRQIGLLGWNMKDKRIALGWWISCHESPASSVAKVSKRFPTASAMNELFGLISSLTT